MESRDKIKGEANNLDLVKKLYESCMQKDFETIKALVHPDYTLTDPMMKIKGVDQLIEMLKACPGGKMENATFISQDDKVVGIFDAVSTDPVSSRMRMCSVMTIADKKVKSEEMFYDTAQIPEEAKELMKKSIPGKRSAA